MIKKRILLMIFIMAIVFNLSSVSLAIQNNRNGLEPEIDIMENLVLYQIAGDDDGGPIV